MLDFAANNVYGTGGSGVGTVCSTIRAGTGGSGVGDDRDGGGRGCDGGGVEMVDTGNDGDGVELVTPLLIVSRFTLEH